MPRCTLKGCPYDAVGKCIENQLPNCPHLVADDARTNLPVAPLASDSEKTASKPTFVTVYSGKKLTAEEASPIFQLNPFVVVLGGMVESGKTTLIARIFEMFQRNEIENHRFMTSRTPLEFARLSWHATMECGGSSPTTEHTYRPENNSFLHLRIRPIDGRTGPVDLLFGDIPGELFPEAVREATNPDSNRRDSFRVGCR
jgi:hypothetical protein